MRMTRELVSPEKAEQWLKLNTINRTLDDRRVGIYAEDMNLGRWNYGHDDSPVGDITFNCDGTLLNGGHRLAAVVQCKKSQWFIVKRDVPVENALLEDHGKPKTINDTLRMFCKIKKQSIPPSLPAFTKAIRVIIQHDGYPGRQQGVSLPFSQWLDWFKKHKADLAPFVTKANGIKALMSQGLAAGLWFLFAKRDAEMAEAFFAKLKTGQGIQKGEPVGVLRQRLIAERAKKPIERVKHYGLAEWTVRAWNATRDGVRWQKLPSNVGGYPRIK